MYADELAQSYAAIRGRLMGRTTSVVPMNAIPPALPKPEPEPEKERKVRYIHNGMGGVWQVQAHEAIIAEVCQKHLISLSAFQGFTKPRYIVDARFEAFYRLRTELGYSFAMIGEACGGKEHAGVMHGIRKYKARLQKEQANDAL